MSRVILITGANTGIGFELARLLAEEGHTTYIGARKEAAGKEAVAQLEADGLKNIKFVILDVTKKESIEAAKAQIEQEQGKLDVLVNNAGISHLGQNQNALTFDTSLARDTIETNFFGMIHTTQAFVPLLRKSTIPGVILNVSTDMASNTLMANGHPLHCVAYNTSKAAANSYMIAVAAELSKEPEGIRVNAVTPGFTTTKLNHFAPGGKSARDGAKTLVKYALLDRNGPTGKFYDERGDELAW